MTCSLPFIRAILIYGSLAAIVPSALADDQSAATSGSPGASTDRPAGDWPCFLGPEGTGVSAETELADSWPEEGPPVLWSQETGVAYAAPSILGERLVQHHRRGDTALVECQSAATGESIWTHETGTEFVDPYGYNGGPRASPLLTDGYCITLGAGGQLSCLALASGEPVWERDLAEDFSLPNWYFGMGCSPVRYQDLVIVLVGGQPDSGAVAFDIDTGKIVWHAIGKPTWDGAKMPDGRSYDWTGEEMLVSYATPTLAQVDGQTHLLCLVRQGLVSLDPASGAERFHYWFRSSARESVNAARPVVVGDTVLITAAYRTGAALIRLRNEGFEEIWRNRDNLLCHWSTPIVVDGLAFGFSGRHEPQGTLRCIELATGNMLWDIDGSESVRERIEPDRFGRRFLDRQTGEPVPWPFFGRGSMILADGKFMLLGERGTLALARLTNSGYEEISRCSVPGISYPAWAAPVLADGRLYVRDEETLVCLDVRER